MKLATDGSTRSSLIIALDLIGHVPGTQLLILAPLWTPFEGRREGGTVDSGMKEGGREGRREKDREGGREKGMNEGPAAGREKGEGGSEGGMKFHEGGREGDAAFLPVLVLLLGELCYFLSCPNL